MVRGDVWQLLRPATAVTLVVATLIAATTSALASPLHHSSSAADKRPYKNFLRFGRGNDAAYPLSAIMEPGNLPVTSGNPGAVYDNLDETDALDLALADVWAAKRAADRNFLRFGRGFNPKNFIRFGRDGGTRAKNFLRFGRDVSFDGTGPQQHFGGVVSSNQEEFNSGSASTNRIASGDVTDDENTLQNDSPHHGGRSKRSPNSGDTDDSTAVSLGATPQGDLGARSKRAVPNLFALLNAPNAGDWIPEEDDMAGFNYGDGTSGEDETLDPAIIEDIRKRAFPRSFLRFGREPSDLHFIRFGKRGSGEEGSASGSTEGGTLGGMAGFFGTDDGTLGSGGVGINQYERILRARNNKNFLRYGR